MNKEEIIEGNKLIAQFLGYEYIPFVPGSELEAGWWVSDITSKKQKMFSKMFRDVFLCRKHSDLKFYSSWDWIIDAVWQLETMNFYISITSTIITIEDYSGVNKGIKPEVVAMEFVQKRKDKLKNLFTCVVNTIKYIKTRKNE